MDNGEKGIRRVAKKLICLFATLAVIFAGCDRQFNIIHVCDHSGNARCLKINQWVRNNGGVEVELADGNNLICSAGTYILVQDYCPLCDAGERRSDNGN